MVSTGIKPINPFKKILKSEIYIEKGRKMGKRNKDKGNGGKE